MAKNCLDSPNGDFVVWGPGQYWLAWLLLDNFGQKQPKAAMKLPLSP